MRSSLWRIFLFPLLPSLFSPSSPELTFLLLLLSVFLQQKAINRNIARSLKLQGAYILHLAWVKKLKIGGVWKCPPHCLWLQRLDVLRITTKRPLIDSLLFLCLSAHAAKISSSNQLTKYLVKNVTTGNEGWMSIWINTYFLLHIFSSRCSNDTRNTQNTVSLQLLLASLLRVICQGYGRIICIFMLTWLSCPSIVLFVL